MQTTLQRGWAMRKVKAKTARLLEAIRENYKAHKAAYAEAFEGYKVEAEEAIRENRSKYVKFMSQLGNRVHAADLDKGQKPVPLEVPFSEFAFRIRPPVDHSASYEVVIRMLEFETSEEVDVTQEEFECFVMDRWDWKDEFVATHANYASKLRR